MYKRLCTVVNYTIGTVTGTVPDSARIFGRHAGRHASVSPNNPQRALFCTHKPGLRVSTLAICIGLGIYWTISFAVPCHHPRAACFKSVVLSGQAPCSSSFNPTCSLSTSERSLVCSQQLEASSALQQAGCCCNGFSCNGHPVGRTPYIPTARSRSLPRRSQGAAGLRCDRKCASTSPLSA